MGDAWAAYYAFELQQGTEVEQTDVLDRYVMPCVMINVLPSSYRYVYIYICKYWFIFRPFLETVYMLFFVCFVRVVSAPIAHVSFTLFFVYFV